jgi:lysophospholipase L1-like esterase
MPKKTLITVLLFAALLAGARYVPGLQFVQTPDGATLRRIYANPEPEAPAPVVASHEPVAPAPGLAPAGSTPTPAPGEVTRPPAPQTGHVKIPEIAAPGGQIVDPAGAMQSFYRALARSEAKQSVTRILHYGDSPTTADLVTADARQLLQRQFGDAGHGFVLIAKPWAWYQHRGVEIKSSGWKMEPLSQSRTKDHLHGLGGVNFQGAAGAVSRIRLADAAHRRVEVLYLKQPGGGDFKVEAGNETILTVPTAGEAKTSGFSSAALPEGTEEVKLTVTRGSVRVYGVSFEKGQPGLIYSSLGLNGASIQHMLRFLEPQHWTEQLQHQSPDLIVLNYGTNESVFPKYVETTYAGELRQVLQRVRTALPNTSVLVMSPMDRADRVQGEIATPQILPKIIAIQRQLAAENGCAFFSTFDAMGGAGTMARWYRMKPRLVSEDFIHPLPGGAAKVGALLDDAIVNAYRQWKGSR